MNLLQRRDIRGRLTYALWAASLLVFVLAGLALFAYQNLTLEYRARQIVEPYAHLLAVGTDAAVAFEDPERAGEILNTLKENPNILVAQIYLPDHRLLASFSRAPDGGRVAVLDRPDGLRIGTENVEFLKTLPSDARLFIRLGMAQLRAQASQAAWMLGAIIVALIGATLAQLAILRRTIVKPIAELTKAAEFVGSHGDFGHPIPVSDTDELATLGRSLNSMMEALQNRERALRQVTDFQNTLLQNAAYGIISCSAEGIITSINPAVERLTGYAASEVVGKQSPLIWHDPAELAMRAVDLSQELGQPIGAGFKVFATKPARGEREEREWTFVRKDGRRVPVMLSVNALLDDQGRVQGFVAQTYDLTERKQAEAGLHRLNRELIAISDCNQILVRAEHEQSLLDDICRIVCENAGYRMAWVGYLTPGDKPTLHPVAVAGQERGYIAAAMEIWKTLGHPKLPQEVAMRTGMPSGIDDIAQDPEALPWREIALERNYRSTIYLPLKDKERVFGLLNIYADTPNAFTPEEQRLLSELGDDLAYGIVTLRTRIEHQRAEEQIQIAATAFEAQEGIMITDADQRILRVNQAFSEITGYPAEEVVGQRPAVLSSGHHDETFYRSMWARIKADGFWQGEVWNRRKNGDLYPEWLTVTAVRNSSGNVTHYVGTMVDITDRKEAERQIEHLAFYDLLTGLPNRRLFVDRLQQAMSGSVRSLRFGALLFVDLDNFKVVNDTCGHDIGDRLLIEVAQRLTSCLREGDTISRLGGDEFVAMLEDLSENPREAAEMAREVADKVLTVLNEPYPIAGRTHHSTPSIGATLFVGNGDSADELLKQADIAMYQAKSAGRNTIRFFDPDMQAAVAARAALESDLREAMDKAQFSLYYQPQVDDNGRMIGAEALLRWHHPERGQVSPGHFIPVAEETDLILPIGQWVLETACSLLTEWSRMPERQHLQLAINVSARQFRQPNFVAQVRAALEASGAPSARLKLELTESLVLDDVEDSIKKMQALKSMGVEFSMDDFGTGYSSLAYLTRLPLRQLKIDQSFVRNLPSSTTDAAVAQAIINLAKSLELEVIAEGVETEAQREFLLNLGCSTFQGYLFSKPIPLPEFDALRF